MKTKYYKFLTENNRGEHSGFDFTEYLPTDQPGKWLPKVDKLEMCRTGYHACKKADVFQWLNSQMFIVEMRGKKIKGDDKDCYQEMRFVKKVETYNDKTLRLFACWCAEEVLPIFEKEYPDDKRPRNAIEVARKYANGKATKGELAVAWDAAGDAAWAAAGDAAWAAARAAARAAAWDAAWAAAWAAAGDAAGDAARAAARAAASAVAWDAAGDAAWAAARKTQLRKFFEMIGE